MTTATRRKLPFVFGAVPLASALAFAPFAPAAAAPVDAPSLEAEATPEADADTAPAAEAP